MLKLITTCTVALIALTGYTLKINAPDTRQADSATTRAERDAVAPAPAPIDELKGEICAGVRDQFDRISASGPTVEAMAAAYREMARLVSTDPSIADYSAQLEQSADAIERGDFEDYASEAFEMLDVYCLDVPWAQGR